MLTLKTRASVQTLGYAWLRRIGGERLACSQALATRVSDVATCDACTSAHMPTRDGPALKTLPVQGCSGRKEQGA